MAKRQHAQPVRLTDAGSIPAVIDELTLAEKASLCGGATPFETHGVERLGIPRLVMADGHNGINIFHLFHNYVAHAAARTGVEAAVLGKLVARIRSAGPAALDRLLHPAAEPDSPPPGLEFIHPDDAAVKALREELARELPAAGLPSCFPTGIVMAATWDPELVAECARAVAQEARAFGMDIVLGPNVNIHRDPLCGRVFESYSEDPHLAARIGVAYIRGMQQEGVAAVVKHFAANNQEHERMGVDERITERALREIYFPAFKAAVQEGGSWMVMSAYNKVNGEACALNRRLLIDILRSEWGFSGFVVSDWGAAYDRAAALRAGNDLEMPGPLDPGEIVSAVRAGKLEERVLDDRVAAILGVMLRLPSFRGDARPPLDRARSAAAARRVAADGMVLLKNSADALPMVSGRIAVFGENARRPIATGTGSAGVVSPYVVSLLDGLRTRFGETNVTFGELPADARLCVIAVGAGSGEGYDRESMALPPAEVRHIREVARRCRLAKTRSVVLLNVCAPVEIADWVDEVDAVLLAWMAGMEMGNAAADLLSGDVSPSGKLPLSWPRRYRDAPTALSFPGEFGESVYGEGIFVGYRYYDTAEVEPLYPFGHGLSYTTFVVSNLRLSSPTIAAVGGTLTASVDVANTGACHGKEVVQLYVHDVRSTVRKPCKELRGFSKVELAPGATTTVTFALDAGAFAHFDARLDRHCVEPGLFELLVGCSSRSIAIKATVRATGENPYALGLGSPIGLVMRTPGAREVLARHLPASAMEDPALPDTVEFFPLTPFGRVWATRLARHLAPASEREIEELRDRICGELAGVELD